MELPRQGHYEIALARAREALGSISVATLSDRCGLERVQPNAISVQFLGVSYDVSLPAGKVSAEDHANVDIREKILLLHYLARADGTPISGKWVSFGELEDGEFYRSVFARRDEDRFLRICRSAPWPDVAAASAKIGGKAGSLGDASLTIFALPRVAITLVLWNGDEELPPAGRILFDSNVNHYLCTEDVTVLCDVLLDKLSRALRSLALASGG